MVLGRGQLLLLSVTLLGACIMAHAHDAILAEQGVTRAPDSSPIRTIPLRRQAHKMEKRLAHVNDLAEHHAMLLQKEYFTHVSKASDFKAEQQKQDSAKQYTAQRVSAQTVTFSEDSVEMIRNARSKFRQGSHEQAPHAQGEAQRDKASGRTLATVPLLNHYNTFFTGQLSIGNEQDVFDVIFDSGSSLTFITSEHCDDIGCRRANRYDSSDSDTHTSLNRKVSVEFGSGSLYGLLATETFYVDGLEIPDTMFIEITDEVGEVFEDGDFDGIVGLSFPEIDDDMPTLFDFMLERGVIENPVFSFFMNREVNTVESELTFGGYNEERMLSDLVYHDVVDKSYWMVLCERILVGDQDTGLCTDRKPCRLVLDSGTSLFTGPSDQLPQLLSFIDTGDGCQGIYDLPSITFVMDGVNYSISPEEYLLTVTDAGVEYPYVHSDAKDVIQCVSTFYALDLDPPSGPLWILGDVFMSKYYTVFERSTDDSPSRIGLAVSNNEFNRKRNGSVA